MSEKQKLDAIEAKIGLHPDFPKKGILFRDIMPILGEPVLFAQMIDILYNRVKSISFDRILGIESRGFLIGPMLAQKAAKPFVPIRKRGKLPGKVCSAEYELEYGHDILEVQKDALPSDCRCLIVDDLIATGGSMEAAKRLVELSKCNIAGFASIIELAELGARRKLGNHPVINLFSY